MDQIKTGSFLKELRKEKGLTQEQLAEQFQVAGRTVSRWENGNNMPDLSLLVEIADFYDVDIREIIEGERKSESMNREEKEKLLAIADYAENDKSNLLKKLRIFSIVGAVAMLVGFIMTYFDNGVDLPVFDFVLGASFGLAFGALVVAIFYSTGILEKLSKEKKSASAKAVSVAAIIVAGLAFIASIVCSF